MTNLRNRPVPLRSLLLPRKRNSVSYLCRTAPTFRYVGSRSRKRPIQSSKKEQDQDREDTKKAVASMQRFMPQLLGLRDEDKRKPSTSAVVAAEAAAASSTLSKENIGKIAAYRALDAFEDEDLTTSQRTKLKKFGTQHRWVKMRSGGLFKGFKGNPT